MLITFIFATIGWIIFRSENIGQALYFFKNIFNSSLFEIPEISRTFVFIAIMLIVEWLNRKKEHAFQISIKSKILRYIVYYAIMLTIVLFSGVQEQFIYFQF